MAVLLRLLIFTVAGLALILGTALRLLYGGGHYTDLSTPPLLDEETLEAVVQSDEPVGNVAVSRDGRIFFTIHPESRPDRHRLMEWKNGTAVPYPAQDAQKTLFQTVLGLLVDGQNRLWTIDHGHHGIGSARLLAFDLATNTLVHDRVFPSDIAQAGSFLQDLQVDAKGETVYIADVSFLRKNPAIIVYDIQKKAAGRVLESDPSVFSRDWIIRTPIREMVFLDGLVALKPGVDGIALDREGLRLYFAAMSHDGLYRVKTSDLRDRGLACAELSKRVERVSRKPLSDGLLVDDAGNVYITDVEHGAVMRVGPDRKLQTVIRSGRIRWADGLSLGPDGAIYIADSARPHVILQSKEHMRSQAPYTIYRFRPPAP